MNQGGNSDAIASHNPNMVKNHQVADASQVYSPYYPTSGSVSVQWPTPKADNTSTENGMPSNSNYHYAQHTDTNIRNVQEGSNTASFGSSSLGAPNAPQEYNGYTSYSSSTDPYGYGNTGYQSYYQGYQQKQQQQQQPDNSYTHPVGAYQNTGAPYQPLSSLQNTGSYTGSTNYSSTYYNPGDYQTSGGYPSSGYSNQTNSWNGGNYDNYASHQYSNYAPDSNSAYSSSAAPATSVQYQQQYKQWGDYNSQTEVTCAPGTETVPLATTSSLGYPNTGVASGYSTSSGQLPQPLASSEAPLLQASLGYPNPGVASGYSTSSSQLPQPSASSEAPSLQYGEGGVTSVTRDNYWKQGGPSGLQSHHFNPRSDFQNHADMNHTYNNLAQQIKSSAPYPALHYPLPPPPAAPPIHPVPYHTALPAATHTVSKLQIQTNPRIASNMSLGTPKINQDNFTSNAAVKPAYISVSLPKLNDQPLSNAAADSMLKPVTFPTSLRGYVERALARCKDEMQMAACQAVMKEVITKATADGTLNTRDWDTEPLFAIPNAEVAHKGLPFATVKPALPELKRSPSRRFKSRWEPVPEEKPIAKLPVTIDHDMYKFNGFIRSNDKDKKSGKYPDKEDKIGIKHPLDQKSASKDAQMPFKRQRLVNVENEAANGDASSDSDIEQSLAAYYPGAITLSNNPDEQKKRDNRSKRFDKGPKNRAQSNHFRPKHSGVGNLYSRKASALAISKTFEDVANRAVEDIDWNALTVKGTCREIEKRYLRLTSAPDPATVRPEDVLEKALAMVQNSQKNYLYKCDQLKSIRQDLTVQHFRNELTVRVYETHARLALGYGDLPEYNQCQSQLKTLYAEGVRGSHMEFSAYNLLCVILHSSNFRELLSSMSRLSDDAKKDVAVKHALAVRAAVTSGNYVLFFKLYMTAPNLNACLMDLYVEKIRYEAVKCMTRSYRPTVPVSYISQVLGFVNVVPKRDESKEKDVNGLDECVEWLKAHGACLIDDTNGEMQLDTKASSSSLYMPEPDDAVAHGDANLAVNDFFTRAPTS